MRTSLITIYTEVGSFESLEQHFLVEHEEHLNANAVVEAYLIGLYGEVETPLCESTIVFSGHKNGDSIITTHGIVRISPEEAEILKRFIPTLNQE